MKLTTGSLWDYLYGYAEHGQVYDCTKERAEFVSVRQYPRNNGVFSADVVYVVDFCKYGIINRNYEKYKNNYFIFVSDSKLNNFCPDQCMVNAYVLGNAELSEVFADISDIRVNLSMWTEKIDSALIANAPLNKLVEIGQEYIPNPFIILDVGLNLLAFTDNINEDDQSFRQTILSGHAPAKLVATIIKKRGKRENHISEMRIYSEEDDWIEHCEEISVPIKVGKKTVAVLYVHCSFVSTSEGLQDVLKYFALKLSYYFERNPITGQEVTIRNEKYEKFFSYILNHEMGEEELYVMAKTLEYPMKATFRLFVLLPRIPDGVPYAYTKVLELFPQERCFIYENRIIIVSAFIWKNSKESEHREIILKRLEKLMSELCFYCGESRQFDRIKDIRGAYVQACKAVELGQRLENNRESINRFEWRKNKENQVYQYNDLYLHHMIESSAKELPLRNICMPEILQMIENDRSRGTNNYQVLYTYLENDRITTEAAALLHMHRNNVNYRIKRIEELYDLNLSNNEERLRIQMTFRALDLMNLE